MPLTRFAARAVIASLLPLGAASFAPHAAWADINVSADTEDSTASSGFGDTLGTLSTSASPAATATNVSILQSKVDALNAQIKAAQRSGVGQNRIAQLQATSNGLQAIITKLNAGYSISSYETSTDVATLVTTVTIKYSKAGSDSTVTQTTYIPPLNDVNEDPDSGTDNSSGGSSGGSGSSSGGGADMLTQLLQQLGMQQMAQQMGGAAGAIAGGGNPMGAIQSTLDNLVKNNGATGPVVPYDPCAADDKPQKGVAVYDIAAGKVYMPDGTVLDAHSGMGGFKDNPNSVDQIGMGATPPNVYNVGVRAEGLYYGVEAVRLTPVGSSPMYGRAGMLAHSKLVRGAQNGSHGCVAFDDYAKFLAAFKNGQVKQLVVVPHRKGDKDKTECTPPSVNTPTPGAAPTS